MVIELCDILPIRDEDDYKVHVASWNQHDHPLDVFVRSKAEWKSWNESKSKKDDFNRDYIFSLIEFYPEPNIWLFGGVFKVIKRAKKTGDQSYKVRLTHQFKPMIGRLKISWKRSGRVRARLFETCIEEFEVSEILKKPYTGESFCGYENINHDFQKLESVFKQNKLDWKTALENVKGVYLIVDKSNGKKYVGSAYGGAGIWSRWSTYMSTGHGYTDELTKLIKAKGIKYARENFRLSLLEHRPMKTDDATIIDRENYWKEALLSRGQFGYNKN